MTDENGYLDQMGEAIERIGTRMETSLALAQAGFQRVGNRLRRRRGGGLAEAVEVADRTVSMYEAIDEAIRDARQNARQGLDKTNARIAQLKKGGIKKSEQDEFQTLLAARQRFSTELGDLDAQFAENQTSLYQARIDRWSAQTEKMMRGANQQSQGLQMWERILGALGNNDAVRNIGEQQLANLQSQQATLTQRYQQAAAYASRDARWQSVADDLAQQLQDVTASIFEQQAENLRNAFESVQARYANASRGLDLQDRVAAVRNAAGDRLGSISQQQGIGAQRVDLARGEASELAALLRVAQAQGNIGMSQELTERIEDLNTSIIELEQANRDLQFTYRQTATEIITGRVERSTGLIGSAQGIIQRLGEMAGSTNTQQIAALVRQAGDQLRTAAREIADNVRAGSAIFGTEGNNILGQLAAAFQQGPNSFATKLGQLGPAIAALEATMGETERTAFQALIESMLNNTMAVLENTDQTRQAHGIGLAVLRLFVVADTSPADLQWQWRNSHNQLPLHAAFPGGWRHAV